MDDLGRMITKTKKKVLKGNGNSFFLYANGSFLRWIWVGSFFYANGLYFYAEGFYFYAEGFYFYANECNCRGALLENVIVAGL